MSILSRNAVTDVLVAANLAIYAYTSVLSNNPVTTGLNVLMRFGLVNTLVMKGFWWQLVTSIFIHINLVHLSFNMIFLFIYGSRAEETLGKIAYLTVYMTSGLVGNISTLVFTGLDTVTISAGASGAIFGILGSLHDLFRIEIRRISYAISYLFFPPLGVEHLGQRQSIRPLRRIS